MNNVKRIAISDMTKEYISNVTWYNFRGSTYTEHWSFHPQRLYSKECSRLNRVLGLHKINKQNNILNFKDK